EAVHCRARKRRQVDPCYRGLTQNPSIRLLERDRLDGERTSMRENLLERLVEGQQFRPHGLCVAPLVFGGAVVVDVVVSVVVVVACAFGSYASAYWPRVNGFHTGHDDGSGNCAGSVDASAGSMNRRQISAGKLPPTTAMPWTLSIGISARVYPTQTVVASSGVYPANHASACSSFVPVFPPAGRPNAPRGPRPDWPVP